MSGSPGLAIRLHGMIDPGRSAELAAAAEKSGFRTVWFAENLFQRGVLPAASASAVATEAIAIGIGIFNPFNRHPTLMAMEAAALDELSDGRAILGIGVGVPPLIDRFTEFERPLAAMRDTVAIARAMLAGETVDHRGKVFTADGTGLGFDPMRTDIPIHIAAMLCGYEEAFAGDLDALAALRYGRAIDPERYTLTLDRLAVGEAPEAVLDDAFVDQYGITGSVEDCLRRIEELGADGATEIALTFLGDDPERDIALIGAGAGG